MHLLLHVRLYNNSHPIDHLNAPGSCQRYQIYNSGNKNLGEQISPHANTKIC
jgi:hypothetical protein